MVYVVPTFYTFLVMETIMFESPKDATLSVGDTLVFDLPYSGGTGYQWEWTDHEIIEKVKEEFIAESDAPGGGGRMHYYFKAVEPGSSTIEFFYWQPWTGKESIEKSMKIQLIVK